MNEELRKQILLTRINAETGSFITNVSPKALNQLRQVVSVPYNRINLPLDDQIIQNICYDANRPEFLKISIKNSLDDEFGFLYAISIITTGEDFEEDENYILIVTTNGIFFFIDDRIAFVGFDSLKDVKLGHKQLYIEADEVKWYSAYRAEEKPTTYLTITKTWDNRIYLEEIKKWLRAIIKCQKF